MILILKRFKKTAYQIYMKLGENGKYLKSFL